MIGTVAAATKWAAALVITAGALWLLHPWTVRPINGASNDPVSPAAFVDRVWAGTLRPALLASAVDARTVVNALHSSPSDARARFGRADGSGSWFVTVRGRGRILSLDKRSSAGVAMMDLEPYDGQADFTLQIGPVVRGSALRDATDLVPFSQFPNQLAYADAANALNARIAKDVLGPVADRFAAGQEWSFVAAGGTTASDEHRLVNLIPLRLSTEPANRD